MRRFGFKQRILLLAGALVVATQLITLFPVLNLIRGDSEAQAERTVGLAGVLFDEYIHNRAEQLLTNVDVLVRDFGFREAVARGDDDATIRSVLSNHARRVGAPVAALLDLDGRVTVSAGPDERPVAGLANVPFDSSAGAGGHRVAVIGGVPYQTVTVALRAPDTVAWVMLGFPIDDVVASHIESLTGLAVSFISLQGVTPLVLSSTLPEHARANASPAWTVVAPNRNAPVSATTSTSRCCGRSAWTAATSTSRCTSRKQWRWRHRRVRNFLFAITGLSLLLAIAGLVLAREDRHAPCRTSQRQRRMREGGTRSRSAFPRTMTSASSRAASTRCRKRSRTANGESSIKRTTTVYPACRTASSSSACSATRSSAARSSRS
jgi:hypothetical protein